MSSTPAPLAATVKEAAIALGVSRWTIIRLIAAEQIHSVKIGKSRRIPRTELERVLGQREVSTKRITVEP
jgi:excisionase family DNA binding protein